MQGHRASLVALVWLLFAARGDGQDIKQLHKQARESIFLLRLFDASGEAFGSGTGFLVQNGLVATNHHVVESAARVEVVLSDEKTVEAAAIVAWDPENDLALLKLPAVDRRPLALESSRSLEPGDRVIVLGSPLGLSGTLSDGIVAALRPHGLGVESQMSGPLLQITAPISPGSSGSPVLNAHGAVVGVAAGNLSGGQNLNFAIPSDTLIALIARGTTGGVLRSLDSQQATTPWSYLRNLGISAAVFVAIFLAFRRLKR
jgi:S1-C subfamily serine protease